MPKDNLQNPPKRLTKQEWAAKQLSEGKLYAYNYTPEELAFIKSGKKTPIFYDPKKFKKEGDVYAPLPGTSSTELFDIKYDAPTTQAVTKPAPAKVATQVIKPQPVEGRKPVEFGRYQNVDPNTGKNYDPITGAEITPIVTMGGLPVVEGKKKGGLVKKYGIGGTVDPLMGPQTQGVVSGIAGPASALGQTAATAIDAANAPNEQGEINKKKAALSGGVRAASTVAPIAANPALIAATGGLSLLAIPVAGGIGAVVGAKKAKEQNADAFKQYTQEQFDEKRDKQQLRVSEAMRQRDLGLAKGGTVIGKGTATSDGIKAKVREGSFIVPAKNAGIAEEIREKVLRKAPKRKAGLKEAGGVDVRLSNGEHKFTPEEKAVIGATMGPEVFDVLAPEAEDVTMLAKGGSVNDPNDKYAAARANKAASDSKKNLGGKRAAPKRKIMDIEPAEYKDLSLSELENIGEEDYNTAAAKLAEQQLANKYGNVAAEAALENNVVTAPSADKTIAPPSTSTGTPINWQNGLSNVLGYGIPAIQTAVGASALSKLGKRPVDKLDPEYLASIEAAKNRAGQAEKEAQYGMTPEEKFLLNQQNQGLLNQSRAAARNYSGGSGTTAFQQERMGINDAFGRGLLTKVKDRALQLQKQGIAADRAAYADQLVAGKTDMNRRLFNDTLAGWKENQNAAGALTSQGLTNAVSQNRYNQFLQNREAYQ